jgi:hypothetical protein
MPNCARVWKQLDDFLVPNLSLNVFDRAVYSYLLRHSHLEGKRRLLFSIAWLAKGIRVSEGAARPAVHRLLNCGALRLLDRTKTGHLIEVLLPQEISAAFPSSSGAPDPFHSLNRSAKRSPNIDALDFFRSPSLRNTIHAREAGSCFYCLRQINETMQCLDHVVPQSRLGSNSYRNLVSACVECNSRKGQTPAADYLLWLYRQRRLTSAELTARLAALDALAAGKLRPTIVFPERSARKTATITPRRGTACGARQSRQRALGGGSFSSHAKDRY